MSEEKYIFCPKCGCKNTAGNTYCTNCGTDLVNYKNNSENSYKSDYNNAQNQGQYTNYNSNDYNYNNNSGYGYGQSMYAGFWLRFVAFIIDSLILSPLAAFTYHPYNVFGWSNYRTGFPGLIVGWLYFAFMESSSVQGTLGKLAVGIKVTDTYGQRLTFGRASGRFFAKLISSVTFGIGYIMIAFTQKKQGLHDMIADCLVVRR